jgi:hypothetical protein
MTQKEPRIFPIGFGEGRFRDRRKAELCRFLEIANINLAESRTLIEQIFEPESAKQMENRVYRIQEVIRELKTLVKQ